MNSLIDIGANLTHDSFDVDRGAVIERAKAAGVERLIVTGTSVTESARAVELARDYPGTLYATAGVHPHHAKNFDEHSAEAIRALAQNDEIVAIGECGLDFFRNFSPPNQQKSAFSSQLELAINVGLPVFLHQRDAHEEFLTLLEPVRDQLSGGVAHCFTGGPNELHAYLNLDLYIGITGWLCDERRGAALLDAVSNVPLDRVLIETDAPYLTPVPYRGKPNAPYYLPFIAEQVASTLALDVDTLLAHAQRNSMALFFEQAE